MSRLRLLFIGVLAAAALALAPGAHAQGGKKSPLPGASSGASSIFEPEPTKVAQINAPSSHFSMVRQGARNAVWVWGQIHGGDAAKLDRAVAEASPVEEVWLFSPGGDLEEGLQMGRVIHAHHLTTHIKRGMECISACNFVFLGGTVRIIDTGAQFKVHMFAQPNRAVLVLTEILGAPATIAEWNAKHRQQSLDPDEYKQWNSKHEDLQLDEPLFVKKSALNLEILDIQQNSAQTAAEIARFLSEMSISLKFLTQFANIPNETPRALSRDELRDFNIVNVD